MWLIFSIAVGSLAAALLLAYLLKSRIKEDVWEELDAPGTPSALSTSGLPLRGAKSFSAGATPIPPSRANTMTTIPPVEASTQSRERDLRRSSRIAHPVPLVILGTDRHGEPFQERTSTVSLNLHGCRYSSRHDRVPEGWVTLQVTGTEGAYLPTVRARVRSVYSPQSARELRQVGVELETPGNVWGLPSPPEDWQRILSASRPAVTEITAMPPAARPEDSARLVSAFETHLAAADRMAEVTMFPGPAVPDAPSDAALADASAPKPERLVLTAEKLLQALQGRLQKAADRAVQAAISTHLEQATRSAIARIDDSWKSNVRQTDEFSTARLLEVQNRWERELVVYRSRAEEIARRLETLASQTRQNLAESQQLLERLTNDIEPQLHFRLEESFTRANSELESRTAQLFERHIEQVTEASRSTESEVRSRLEKLAAEARALLENAPAAVSEQRIESLVNSSRECAFNQMEERLGEFWRQFEQQQDQARLRSEEMARQLEKLSADVSRGQSEHARAVAEVRSFLPDANAAVSPAQLDSRLNSTREQFHNLLEWRLGEVSAQWERHLEASRQRAEEIGRRLDSFAADTRSYLDETRKLAEREPQPLPHFDLATIEQSVDRAAHDFETAAARISDRQLIRLMEQKQVLAREVSLELEARSSEARALLQKTSNATLDDFQRRVEGQIDHVIAEATERVVSTLATLDAENRAVCEARRHTLEADVARAAEQSTAEFRTGIKAFLYSCLVAAVTAVDEHAQNTMASLVKDSGTTPSLTLDSSATTPSPAEPRSSAASASSSSTSTDSHT